MRRRLLTLGHSYVVAQNRRLAHEMAKAGQADWEVVAVAPRFFCGDLRPIALEPLPEEANRLCPVDAHLTRSPHLFWYGRALRKILQQRWDLVHIWEEPFVVAGWQAACWANERSTVVFATAQNLAKRYPPPFRQLERRAVARANGIIAWGKTVEENLTRQPIYREKPFRALPLGVDCGRFAPVATLRQTTRRLLGLDSDGRGVVGFLGRFVPEKGLLVLMQALEKVRAPWSALFVGGGPLEGRLRRWAQGFGSHVRIETGVTHDDVPKYLNAMDVLCAPSQTAPHWSEQFGRMLVEAMACGVAVLGSDSGEIPHTLDGAGEVLPEANVDAWARAIGSYLEDRTKREAWAQRGLERARAHFDWPVVARAHLSFFETLLRNRP